ncbi:hypothetical protein N9A94_08050 [Akkermansiaceae bacterium]|nr:hypothetical protein [Akkermansiaceae bacterium]MDA7888641.1 hypothetical protein [Akkermansiaceae bacterium]
MRKWVAIICVLLTIGGLIVYSLRSPKELNQEVAEPTSLAVESALSLRVITRSLFNEEYAAQDRNIEDDLETISDLVINCQQIIKNFDTFFLPDNEAITSFLRGDNPEKIAWIPPNHSAINQDGELVDRNGVPVFFHRESGLQFQIRSAGEDQIMWTSDDVVYPDRGVVSDTD